jgi:hypothetical protein
MITHTGQFAVEGDGLISLVAGLLYYIFTPITNFFRPKPNMREILQKENEAKQLSRGKVIEFVEYWPSIKDDKEKSHEEIVKNLEHFNRACVIPHTSLYIVPCIKEMLNHPEQLVFQPLAEIEAETPNTFQKSDYKPIVLNE